MKKTVLTCAGIGAAIVLAAMFLWILFTGTFTFLPAAAIDPIPDQAAGQTVIISGTTNCIAGTFMDLDVVPLTARAGYTPPVRTLSAFISRGPQGTNVWSAALDTTRITPGSYIVHAYWMNETTRSELLATSFMRITDAPAGSASTAPRAAGSVFIAVNSPAPLLQGTGAEITGTTNLQAGTGLLWSIAAGSVIAGFPETPAASTRGNAGSPLAGTLIVKEGAGGINRWSFAANTESLPSGPYRITVTRQLNAPDQNGDAAGTALLFIQDPGAPGVPGTAKSGRNAAGPCSTITIDAFPDRWIGRNYTISGTSSFPSGTDLLIELRPEEIQLTMNMGTGQPVASMSGAMGHVTTEPGPGTTSLWYLTLDRGSLNPDQRIYLVNVTNNRIDPATYAAIEGGSWCSERLVLPEWLP